MLNELDFTNENRFILCNFIDQNSELFSLGRDIYEINDDVTLKQLFLFAYSKARINNLVPDLYSEYINSINAKNRHSIKFAINLIYRFKNII
ncbi:MAG: hypothetical protein ACTSQ1_05405 [Promethearchaeota archaeon]